MTTRAVTIPARFCGPPGTANGGYTCGLIAEQLGEPCVVTLRAPTPLDTPLNLARDVAGQLVLQHDTTLLAEGAPSRVELELPEPVAFSAAERAVRDFIGYRSHPYPRCFVCGTERSSPDGLALYPGPVAGRPLVASPWLPGADLCDASGRVTTRFIWAALDCPSWFGFITFAEREVRTLLGRLSAEIRRAPLQAEPCVVVGWHLGTEGRRIQCASAIYGADSECIAYARSTWIALKAA